MVSIPEYELLIKKIKIKHFSKDARRFDVILCDFIALSNFIYFCKQQGSLCNMHTLFHMIIDNLKKKIQLHL